LILIRVKLENNNQYYIHKQGIPNHNDKAIFQNCISKFHHPRIDIFILCLVNTATYQFCCFIFYFSFYTGYQSWLLSDIMLYPLPIIVLAIYLRKKNRTTVVWEAPKLFQILLSLLVVVLYFLFTIISHNFFPVSVAT